MCISKHIVNTCGKIKIDKIIDNFMNIVQFHNFMYVAPVQMHN